MENSQKMPLVSVYILTYGSLDHLYSTLDSIFEQDYPNIEIVISDDGTPDFETYRDAIEEYINSHKRNNIKRIVIHHFPENVGTSKNANNAIRLSTGEYIRGISPGDELYNSKVLSDCVTCLQQENARVLIGKTFVKRRTGEDCDDIKETISYRWKARSGRLCNYTPPTKDIKYLQSLPNDKRNEILMSRCIISTVSVFYRRDLFEETNGFPETYRLVEDMPFWPYLAKKGERFVFCDIIMVKYSLGGVSNGAAKNKEFNEAFWDVMTNTYIPNDRRGGILNPILRKIRLRQVDYQVNSGSKIRYMDVMVYNFLKQMKYLLIGSKL